MPSTRFRKTTAPKDRRLDAVVFLTREDGRPGARVWTARATDHTVEDFVRDSM
ncbi:MAG: ABC transporter permease, partial [Caulobacteraceae bacterium]